MGWFFFSRLLRRRREVTSRSARIWRCEQLEAREMLAALAVDTRSYATSRILVHLTDSSSTVAPLAAGLQWGQSFALVPGLREVQIGSGISVSQALDSVRSLRNVDFAEPDYRVTADATTNDPRLGSLWGLNNSGQSGGTADADIDAPEAWNTTTGSGNFVVGVIDSGVDYRHPDLAANMWSNPDEIVGNGIDDDRNGYIDDRYGYDFVNNDADPMDDNGHGTHVAGTIGAVGNNGIGVSGVNWRVKIAALKFLDASGGGYTSDAVRALDYAVREGIRVTNNSWGGGGDSSSLRAAIQRAQAAGSIFVAAAGNDGSNNDTKVSYPSNYPYDNVVAVAATDRNDRLASFSNYGATSVDLAAPGVSILSTTPNNTYSTYSGTSMATPHVTGAIALLWDRNPTWTYRQVIGQIVGTVDPVASLSGKVATGGRLNIAKALGSSVIVAPDTTGPRVITASPSGVVAAPISSYTFTFSEPIAPGSFTVADVNSFTNPAGADIRSSITSITGAGTIWTVNFTPQTANGYYPIIIGPNVIDLAGNKMDQNRNGVKGETTGDRYGVNFQIVGSTVGTPTTYSNSNSTIIRDLSTTSSLIAIADTAKIADLNVVVNLRHSYIGDLTLRLLAPDGTSVLLSSRRGASSDYYINTVFDSEATTAITSATSPFTGNYRPQGSLAVLNGKSMKGNWTLQIVDSQMWDSGTLQNWSIVVTPTLTSTSRGSRVSITNSVSTAYYLLSNLTQQSNHGATNAIRSLLSAWDRALARL
jgi:serine protease